MACSPLSILLCITVIFIGAVVQQNKVASPIEFGYTSSNNGTLRYNLALNVSIGNPNRRLGIYYHYAEAKGVYQGARFGSRHTPPFYMGHKTTHCLTIVFKGQHLISLRAHQASEYSKQTNSGVYQIDVKLYLSIRFKLGFFQRRKFEPEGAMSSAPIQNCDSDF